MSQHLTGRAKRLTVLVAALLACALLFSVLFLVTEANHHCERDDCAICAQIAVCEELLQKLALAVLALIIAALVFRVIAVLIHTSGCLSRQVTLITLKVKLSD